MNISWISAAMFTSQCLNRSPWQLRMFNLGYFSLFTPWVVKLTRFNMLLSCTSLEFSFLYESNHLGLFRIRLSFGVKIKVIFPIKNSSIVHSEYFFFWKKHFAFNYYIVHIHNIHLSFLSLRLTFFVISELIAITLETLMIVWVFYI